MRLLISINTEVHKTHVFHCPSKDNKELLDGMLNFKSKIYNSIDMSDRMN